MADSGPPPLQQILKDTLHSSTDAMSKGASELPETLRSQLTNLTTHLQSFADWIQGVLRQYVSRQNIRLVWIVCAYLLLRPWINAFFARGVPKPGENAETGAKVQPNQIRGGTSASDKGKKAPDGSLLDAKPSRQDKSLLVGKPITGKGGDGTGADADWGAGARKRQTKFVEQWEKDERRKAEMAQGEDEIDPELLHD